MIVLGLVLMLIGFVAKIPVLVVPGDSGRPDRDRSPPPRIRRSGDRGPTPLVLIEVPAFASANNRTNEMRWSSWPEDS